MNSLAVVLKRFGVEVAEEECAQLEIGLINTTFEVGGAYILQRLHPIFTGEVNCDIDALVKPLTTAGVPVPSVVRTKSGKLWVELSGEGEADGVWRMLTRLPGRSVSHVKSPKQARSAGVMLERFHRALLETMHEFAFVRAGAHDTPKHMETLRAVIEGNQGHRLEGEVSKVGVEIMAQWDSWGWVPKLPSRIIHGDPKINNFLFAEDEETVTGVVDLDTMAWSSVDVELGDAVRSWCSTGDESCGEVGCDLDLFEAAMAGYLARGRAWLTPAELMSLPAAAERICLELASRFAADALNECYFRWDPDIAPTWGEHNLLRAKIQLSLAKDLAKKRGEMGSRLARLLRV